jgi:hypothetical protein
LGCWISPCYGQFSLGVRFESYEMFISLIINFLGGRGELRTPETMGNVLADTESMDAGPHLY